MSYLLNYHNTSPVWTVPLLVSAATAAQIAVHHFALLGQFCGVWPQPQPQLHSWCFTIRTPISTHRPGGCHANSPSISLYRCLCPSAPALTSYTRSRWRYTCTQPRSNRSPAWDVASDSRPHPFTESTAMSSPSNTAMTPKKIPSATTNLTGTSALMSSLPDQRRHPRCSSPQRPRLPWSAPGDQATWLPARRA